MSIALSTMDALTSAIAHASAIEASAYRLPPAMERDLEAAAERGARVDVALASAPAGAYDERLAAENAAAAERLRAAGARARLAGGLHAKAAVVDGVAWLDDRNFARSGPSNLVRDDGVADVASVRSAIAGTAAPGSERLAFEKTGAIALEAGALSRATPGEVALSTESFGYGAISSAIRRCRSAGTAVRLIVDRREAASPREASALAAMAKIGVEIRTANAADKVALTRDEAWLGSANATYCGPGARPQSDWGALTSEPQMLAEIRTRYERAWDSATPLGS